MGQVSRRLIAPISHASFLLVVPVFRPGPEFGEFLPRLCTELAKSRLRFRVQVVDDGNDTEVGAEIQELVASCSSLGVTVSPVVVLARNAGKGAAVYAGWRTRQAEAWLGFVDCDGAVSPMEVVRLAEIADCTETAAAVIGSRLSGDSTQVQRRWHRQILGRLFVFGVNHLLGVHVHDSQCGLKWIPAEAYARALPSLEERRFAFDVDLLLALRHQGVTALEVPISWADARHSSIRLWIDGPSMAAALVRLFWRYRIKRPGSPNVAPNDV